MTTRINEVDTTPEVEQHARVHARDEYIVHVFHSGHATYGHRDNWWCADGFDCEVPTIEELECCIQQHDPQLSCEEARAETRAR